VKGKSVQVSECSEHGRRWDRAWSKVRSNISEVDFKALLSLIVVVL